jgi:hypothetical protein
VRLRLGRAMLERDGPMGLVQFDAAGAIAKARRASTPVTSGAWPVRTGLYEAGELSVSIATVDRVLSGRTVVRESAAARVQAAAQALGFQFAEPTNVRLGGILGQVFWSSSWSFSCGFACSAIGGRLSLREINGFGAHGCP